MVLRTQDIYTMFISFQDTNPFWRPSTYMNGTIINCIYVFPFCILLFYAGSGAVLQVCLIFTITFEVDSSLLFTWGRLKRQVSKHLIAGLSMEKSYLTNMVLGSPLAALPQIFLFHTLTLSLKARSKPSAIVVEKITCYKIRWQASKWRDIHGLSLKALVVTDCKSNSERVDNFALGWEIERRCYR